MTNFVKPTVICLALKKKPNTKLDTVCQLHNLNITMRNKHLMKRKSD